MTDILSEDDIRLVKMCKALGNPVRLQIVEELERCQPCLCGNIVAKTTLAQSTVSHHLKVLKDAGLIQGYEEGASVFYCLERDGLIWFKNWFQTLVGIESKPINRKVLHGDDKLDKRHRVLSSMCSSTMSGTVAQNELPKDRRDGA